MPLLHERDARAYIWAYNIAVPARPHRRPDKRHIYTLEAAGILIVGALVLAITLARYWHHIAWGAR